MFLFTMLFSLITLPFVLIRMAFGLLGISTHILMIPLKIFARHTVLCLIIAAVLILYFAIKSDPRSVDSLKPDPTRTKQAKEQPKGAPPVIQEATKQEDGDSVFATDTYVMMTDAERMEYSKNFYNIMRTVPDGDSHTWAYFNIHGSMRPIRTFKNNAGDTCRTFTEILKVHHIQQTISGTACDNGGGSWCKLKPNATPQCGLGYSPGAFEGLSNAVKNLF